jgi:sigma-B regulation protein RsbU (phosphoserine phosphatase)
MVESSVFERIRGGLLEKRQTLTGWLGGTPAAERRARLGPAREVDVRAEIQTIDRALLQADEGTLGQCQVCCEPVNARLLEMDYTACVCLDHLSEAEQDALETELELSQTVQRALLPGEPPEIPGVELAAFNLPAQIVGGDAYDFAHFRDGGHALAISDVAGHGVSAGLLMASTQAALRTLVPEYDAPEEVLARINHFFNHNVRFTTFVTLFLARLDPAAHTLRYSNAGHNPPLLCHPTQGRDKPNGNGESAIAWLGPTGAAIGLVEEFRPGAATVELAPGDVLVLYTDGITEAISPQGQPFGEDGLAAVVRDSAGLSAREITQRLWGALQEFTGGAPLADDATAVAVRVVA